MRVRLTEIKVRPTGKRVRLDRDVEVESLFVGRGPDNDLALKGLTISLHHATIRMSEGRLYVEAAAGKQINVNGLVTTGERLAIGDRLGIGAWEIRVLEPDTNMDVSLEYEEVDRADSERSALDARIRLGIEAGAMARRPLSWIAVGLVVTGFLLVPLVWNPAQTPWTTGQVSRGHAYIESECQQCHSGFFRGVQNDACATCHYDIGRHAPANIEVARLENAACADCHLEHRGREASLADRGSIFCADCHADMSALLPSSELRKVTDFGTDHPPFEISVVTDPSEPPTMAAISAELVEDSGLAFDHLMHVGSGVENDDEEEVFLDCGVCHQPDALGQAMRPIVFEEHCQDCHSLAFDRGDPDREAPHGGADEIRTFIREFYWTRVLSGAVDDADAPSQLRNRRANPNVTAEETEWIRPWVDGKLAAVEEVFYGRSGTCTTCHRLRSGLQADLEAGAANAGGIDVVPVQIQYAWMPGVSFSHDSHAPFTCARCHPAAAVLDPDADLPRPDWSLEGSIPYALIPRTAGTPTSESSSDIMIPAIETCRECHAGMNASGSGVVPSPCSMCHPFHMRELGTMHSARP